VLNQKAAQSGPTAALTQQDPRQRRRRGAAGMQNSLVIGSAQSSSGSGLNIGG
jgi:hypothetical protein